MIDWADPVDLQATIDNLEERDRLARVEQAAEFARRKQARRANQAVRRAEAIARFKERQAEKEAARQAPEKSEVIALFEQTRKARLERDARRERLKQGAPEQQVAPEPTVTPAAQEPEIIPASEPADLHVRPEDLAGMYPNEEESVEILPPSEMPAEPAERASDFPAFIPMSPEALSALENPEGERPTEPPAEPAGTTEEWSIDRLDDSVLRYVLNEFSVKGRQKLKTHKALVRAVEQLELAPEDLRKLVEDRGRKE